MFSSKVAELTFCGILKVVRFFMGKTAIMFAMSNRYFNQNQLGGFMLKHSLKEVRWSVLCYLNRQLFLYIEFRKKIYFSSTFISSLRSNLSRWLIHWNKTFIIILSLHTRVRLLLTDLWVLDFHKIS